MAVRSAAFTLFAALSRFGHLPSAAEGKSDAASSSSSSSTAPASPRASSRFSLSDADAATYANNFMDQMHINLPIFVVHLCDEENAVRQSVLPAFTKISTLLDSSANGMY